MCRGVLAWPHKETAIVDSLNHEACGLVLCGTKDNAVAAVPRGRNVSGVCELEAKEKSRRKSGKAASDWGRPGKGFPMQQEVGRRRIQLTAPVNGQGVAGNSLLLRGG